MKDARYLIWAAALSLVLMISTGCTETSTTSPEDDGLALYSSSTESSDGLLLPMNVEDATLDNAMMVSSNANDFCDNAGGEVRDNGRDRKPHPGPFDRLLRALKLTTEQQAQVREFLAAHKECVSSAMQVMREATSEIIEGANAARQEVLAKLQAGEITREEARAAIREINQRAREAIKNSDVVARVREMLKSCDEEFIAKLKQILTEDQLALLDRWLNSRGNGGGNPTGSGERRG